MGLHSTVYLMVNGEVIGYGPDDEVPEHIARQIGAHAFEDGVHPFPDNEDDGQSDQDAGEAPPRPAAGSSRKRVNQ